MKKNKSAKIYSIITILIVLFACYFIYNQYTFKNIEFTSNAFGANIIINKKFAGNAPLRLYLEPGKYHIGISQKGYVVKYDSIEVTNSHKKIHFNLLEGFRYIRTGKYYFRDEYKRITGFYLSESEVTNKLYREFCNETGNDPSYYENKTQLMADNQPTIGVNYIDAVKFTEWFSKRTGYKCRLPYEYEWEYAANNGDTSIVYPWGNQEKNGYQYFANYHPYDSKTESLLPINIDGYQYTSPIKSFPPGINQLYDMGGNVFEWMLDSIENKNDYPDMNLKITPDSLIRIVKGGSWNFNQKLMAIKSHVFVNGSIRRGNNGIRLLIEKPVP